MAVTTPKKSADHLKHRKYRLAKRRRVAQFRLDQVFLPLARVIFRNDPLDQRQQSQGEALRAGLPRSWCVVALIDDNVDVDAICVWHAGTRRRDQSDKTRRRDPFERTHATPMSGHRWLL